MLRGLFAKRAGIAAPDRDETARVKAIALGLLNGGESRADDPSPEGRAESKRSFEPGWGLPGRGSTPPRSAAADSPSPSGRDRGGVSASSPVFDVTVSEIVCLDPACPGTETVLLVMAAGAKTRAAKVAKPAAEVTEPDVRAALLEAGFEVRT